MTEAWRDKDDLDLTASDIRQMMLTGSPIASFNRTWEPTLLDRLREEWAINGGDYYNWGPGLFGMQWEYYHPPFEVWLRARMGQAPCGCYAGEETDWLEVPSARCLQAR